MTPWFSDQEIDDLCAGVHTNAAKARRLRAMGLTVTIKPNGRALVMRGHAERILSGMPKDAEPPCPVKVTGTQPDRSGLILQFAARRG